MQYFVVGPLDSRRGGHRGCPVDHIYVNKSAACIPVCTAEHGIKGVRGLSFVEDRF